MQNENISLTTLDPMPHFYCSSGWFLVALTLMQSLELPILHTHETQIRNRQWLVREDSGLSGKWEENAAS